MSHRRPPPVAAAIAVALTALTLIACRRVGPASVPQADATEPGQQINRISLEARPPLILIAREGDPHGAVAVALAHDFGSRASVALAALVAERLRGKGLRGLQVDAHEFGLEVSALVASPKAAKSVLFELSAALKAKAAPTEAERAAIAHALQALHARTWAGPAEAQVARCSGDLGILSKGRPTVPATATLEQWRAAVFSTQSARFAVIGPTPLLREAADSLESLPDWP
jgi:hypothetical protein